jgi:ABC-type Mn2+/Zn2+ transport system permease subunit
VIGTFLASWDLFATTYLVGALAALVLATVGVWVVARDQIFLGAAVSQASALGAAVALWLTGFEAIDHGAGWAAESAPTLLPVAASVATAWLAARGSESGTDTPESITGWIFLLAASLPVLIVAHSPHGLEEVQRLLFSTLLSVSDVDLALFAALALLTGVGTLLFHRRLLLLAVDPLLAGALGLRGATWNFVSALWLGTAVGLAIHAAGTLFTFGCLVLPALLAKGLCREVRGMLLAAPVLALAATFAGFVVAYDRDLPPAHTTVALLAGVLPLAWMLRSWHRSREGRAATAPVATD